MALLQADTQLDAATVLVDAGLPAAAVWTPPVWTPPEGATEEYYAGLPFPEAQDALSGPVEPRSGRLATAGWHTTMVSPLRGSFAVVRSDGPLADLVGLRLKVTAYPRSVVVYVAAETRQIEEDISLYRRAFLAIGLLALTDLAVRVEVLA